MNVIAEETRNHLTELPLRERQRAEDIGQQTDDYWGYFWLEVGVIPPEELERLTLFQLAEREFQAIERVLRRAAGKLSYTVEG